MSKPVCPTNVMAIPEDLQDINHTWLSALLGFSISPSNFVATPNAQEGSGFLSQILRISCEKSDGSPVKLIVKLLPQGSSSNTESAKNLVVGAQFDIKEINFYSTVCPDLIQVVPELEKYMCHYYTSFITENPRNSILVMEDLKPAGYHTINFGNYLPITQIEECVKFLAKFHYAGTVVQFQKKQPLDQLYPVLLEETRDDPSKSSVFSTFKDGLAQLDTLFEKQKLSEDFRGYFRKLLPEQDAIFNAVFKAMNKHETLIHGDLWSNNLLVLDDAKSIKVIDWQTLAYKDPAFDLAVVVISLLPPDLLKWEEVDRLLRLYYDTYTNLFRDNGLEHLLTRGWEELSTVFYTHCMGYVFVWFTYGEYPFAANLPRLVKIYEFLQADIDIVSFLLTLV